jgi:hypothetical protein
LVLATSCTLLGCSQSTPSQEHGAGSEEHSSLYHFAVLKPDTEAESQKPVKKPKPGRKPKTKADYTSAIESVKRYKSSHPAAGMHNGYVSKQLVKDLLANSKCEGIRMYLADSAGQERMIVIGVDKDGVDLVTPTTLEDPAGLKSQGRYLFGISEDKCPENCVGATLYE